MLESCIVKPIGSIIYKLKNKFSSESDIQTDTTDKNIFNNKSMIHIENELKKVSDKISDNTSAVKALISEIQKSANNNLTVSEKLTEEISDISAKSEEMYSSIKEIEQSIAIISQKTLEASKNAEELSCKSNNLKTDVLESVHNAKVILNNVKKELNGAIEDSKQVEEIYKFSTDIMSITKQTNLLALNASIEAARAGEAGKGFTVVAGEVRKLAEESEKIAKNINRIINNVSSSFNRLSLCSNEVVDYLDKNVNNDYDKFIKVCEEYDANTLKLSNIMNEVSTSTEEINASVEEITKVVNEVTNTINKSADSVTEMSFDILNTVDKVYEVEEKVGQNIEVVDGLKLLTQKF